MLSYQTDPKPAVFLLADHLDAMLAAGEDLLAVRGRLGQVLTCPEANTFEGRAAAQRLFVSRVRSLELTLAIRTLEARKTAARLPRADTHLRMMAGLFVSGTTPLADAAADLGDRTRADFETGHEVVSYLRSRGIIPRDAAGPVDTDDLAVTPGFLVAARIELGSLLDLAATFLDTLDLIYEVYGFETPDLGDAAAAQLGAQHTSHS
jgi:hypothetical protein